MENMVRAGLLVLALSGCGRLGFDTTSTGATQTADAATASSQCAFDLCDDFEADQLDTSLWTIDSMVGRDTSVAHRGGASVRMHVDQLQPGEAAAEMLAESRTLASSRELWVRGWFRLSALPADGNELEVIGLTQSPGAAAPESVFVSADQVGFTMYGGGITATTNAVMPVNTWFCLLWHVRLATTGGAIDLSGELFDGPEATGGETDTDPPIMLLRIGGGFSASQITAQQPSLDVWIDDLIVHSAPLTCAS